MPPPQPLLEKPAEPAGGIANTEGESGRQEGRGRFVEQERREKKQCLFFPNPRAKRLSQEGTRVEEVVMEGTFSPNIRRVSFRVESSGGSWQSTWHPPPPPRHVDPVIAGGWIQHPSLLHTTRVMETAVPGGVAPVQGQLQLLHRVRRPLRAMHGNTNTTWRTLLVRDGTAASGSP